MINPNDVEPMPEEEPDAGFWSQTDILAHVHRFARSRGPSPYATLGAVLRRVTGCNVPCVVLPATIGGQASLNLFTVSVGHSGGGKDIANAAGRDAVDFFQDMGKLALVPVTDAALIHPSTGEGLARIFKGRKDEPGVTRAHLQVRRRHPGSPRRPQRPHPCRAAPRRLYGSADRVHQQLQRHQHRRGGP